MFVTSASKVLVPGASNFVFMLCDQSSCVVQLLLSQPIVYRELDLRFNPEFSFSVGAMHVNMNARLFSREEKESEAARFEDCRLIDPLYQTCRRPAMPNGRAHQRTAGVEGEYVFIDISFHRRIVRPQRWLQWIP